MDNATQVAIVMYSMFAVGIGLFCLIHKLEYGTWKFWKKYDHAKVVAHRLKNLPKPHCSACFVMTGVMDRCLDVEPQDPADD